MSSFYGLKLFKKIMHQIFKILDLQLLITVFVLKISFYLFWPNLSFLSKGGEIECFGASEKCQN